MKNEKIKLILIGFVSGIISGFFGAGGGLILVPFLQKILKINEKAIRATTIFCIFFMVIITSFFYIKNNSIDLMVAIKCVIGGIVGSYIGTKLLYRLNIFVLNFLFVIFLIYSGIKMII